MNPYKEAPQRPRRCPRLSRREVTQRTNHPGYCNRPFMYIYSPSLVFKKSLKPYLRMLNIFDPLLSVMQTDNHVYFFLPIDTYAVFLTNTTDGIKDECAPTRRLCNCSLVCNLSVWYLYSLSYLHWLPRHAVQQTLEGEKKLNRENLSVNHLLYLLSVIPLSCSFFFVHK